MRSSHLLVIDLGGAKTELDAGAGPFVLFVAFCEKISYGLVQASDSEYA